MFHAILNLDYSSHIFFNNPQKLTNAYTCIHIIHTYKYMYISPLHGNLSLVFIFPQLLIACLVPIAIPTFDVHNMCVCVTACACVCMCMCVCVTVHVHVCMCMYTTCVYVSLCMCMCHCACVCVCVCVYKLAQGLARGGSNVIMITLAQLSYHIST